MKKQFEVESWPSWEEFSTLSENYKNEFNLITNFSSIDPPETYKLIWKEVSMATQIKKANNHGLKRGEVISSFQQLVKRPYFLCELAKQFQCENFAEVGTAQGLQFFSFAHYNNEKSGHVWSCDIQDVRNKVYVEKYKHNTSFCLGDSAKLATDILSSGEKIDFFYIDGAHRKGSVIQDVKNLKITQSENPIWVFDDFDTRFGCYEDIKYLCMKNKNFAVYRVGDAASGNPNHQVVIVGKISNK